MIMDAYEIQHDKCIFVISIMKTSRIIFFALAAVMAVACNNKKKDEIQPVWGTLDHPLQEERAPEKVHGAMTLPYTDRYENILDDHGVSVWSLLWCNPDISAEGYGIHVVKDKKTTPFPNIYHGRNPWAEYNADKDLLWLSCTVMGGTGIHVEKPYLFRFDETGSAIIETKLEPYEIQQALRKRLSYKVQGDDITFYDNGQPICTVTNTITDMGGLDDEQPVWIGEQLSYFMEDGDLYVRVTPGAKFTTGLVLMYDDMPELTAKISFNDYGALQIGGITVAS